MTDIQRRLKQSWLPVAKSSELKTKPLACRILDTPLVLFRDSQHLPVALLDRCPHRNAPLSQGKIENNCLVCPYHGWVFDEQGECQSIPGLVKPHGAKIPAVPRFNSREEFGLIWVQLDDKGEVCPPFAPQYFDHPQYHSFVWTAEVTGSLVNILENFLDGTHTHFVHSGLIRDDRQRQKITAHLTTTRTSVEIRYSGEAQQSGYISKLFEAARGDSFGRFVLPAVAELEFCSPSHTTFMITAYVTPLSEQHHKIHAIISFRKRWIPGRLAQWIISPFLNLALRQDKWILDQQRKTIDTFGGEKYCSTELDLIRPSLQRLLDGSEQGGYSKTIEMNL